ncbi:hypothetical protein [Botrimarina sp.]|uniref:hypothetical protein n=1 Tax=Botrimarina sp. TaxID=2795802 RepID=UPI0032EEDD8C
MNPPRTLITPAAAITLLALATAAIAHPDHGPAVAGAATAVVAATAAVAEAGPDATTGSGDLRFRYRADLSQLPGAINASIERAHGGFAKAPDGSLYFGLKGVGVVRVSADLREKTVVAGDQAMQHAGLHNTTYVDRDGGLLVLPDNEQAKVYVLKTDGSKVGELGRPAVNDYYRDDSNPYRPTDTDVGTDGTLYVCDGYSPGKYVVTADLGGLAYNDFFFGGAVSGPGREEGRFSTNHGVTRAPSEDALVIADRERQWLQKVTPKGDFIEGYDTAGGDVCDVDFVDFGGQQLMVAGCLKSEGGQGPGFVAILKDGEVASVLRPKLDLGLEQFQHIHNAVGVVVDGKLFVLCYGWNPGCYAVLEHVAQ